VILPGDEAISHRFALLASLADGPSKIANYSPSADCRATLACIRALGIQVDEDADASAVTVHGRGLLGWTRPQAPLDAAGSRETFELLEALLSAQTFPSTLLGAETVAIPGGPAEPGEHTLAVPDARRKTALLLRGLFAHGQTVVREPSLTPDHTETALREFGADVKSVRRVITLQGRPALQARELAVPGDLTSAAYFIAAGLLVPGSRLLIQNVGLNPTRASLLDFLMSSGAQLRVARIQSKNGEMVGDIEVRHSEVRGGVLDGWTAAGLSGELPALAVLCAASGHGLLIQGAPEGPAGLADHLASLDLQCSLTPEGLRIPGRQAPGRGLAVLATAAARRFPDFQAALDRLSV